MSTLHVLLSYPSAQALLSRLAPGDAILALGFVTPTVELERAIKEVDDVEWITHDMRSPKNIEAATFACLKALADLGSVPVHGDASLREVLALSSEPQSLSLWWFVSLTEHRLRTQPVMQMIVRQWWLVHANGLNALNHTKYDAMCVWEPNAHAAALWRASMTLASVSVNLEHVNLEGTSYVPSAPSTHKGVLNGVAQWQLGRRNKARYKKVLSLTQTLVGTKSHEAKTADILIVTLASAWYEDEHGEFRHRYFDEVARSLHAQGHNVAWLPVPTLLDSAKTLHHALTHQHVPVCWSAFEHTHEDLQALEDALDAVRARWSRARDAVLKSSSLQVFGLDMRDALVNELDQFLREDALKYTLMTHMTACGVRESHAHVVLYRDELYFSGRAISAAKHHAHDATFLALQHGLITTDHWTYLYDSSDLTGPNALPLPDLFMTYGDHPLELMAKHGYPRGRLVAIGSLRHDDLVRRAQDDTRPAPQAMGLPTDRPTFLICTQLIKQIPGWIERVVEGLREAGIQGHVAVKQHHFHRSDDVIEATFLKLGWRDYSVHTTHLEDLLRQSVAALTQDSTVGLEALLLGTPLICFTKEEEYESFPYVSDHGAMDGRDATFMADAMTCALRSPERLPNAQAFLRRHLENMRRPALSALDDLIAQYVPRDNDGNLRND